MSENENELAEINVTIEQIIALARGNNIRVDLGEKYITINSPDARDHADNDLTDGLVAGSQQSNGM